MPPASSSTAAGAPWPASCPTWKRGTSFNALNFNLAEYNDAYGANYTGASQVVAVFLCPSSTRSPDGGRDGVDPNDPFSAINNGYGYNDYGPTVYTDISPLARRRGRRPAVDPLSRQELPGPTACSSRARRRIAEVTDGTSNTIAIAEDAGRDPRYLSPYTEGYWNNVITRQAAMASINPNDPGSVGRLYALSPLLALGRARRGLRRLRHPQ